MMLENSTSTRISEIRENWLLLILASIVSSTTTSNSHSELKNGISSSLQTRLTDFLWIPAMSINKTKHTNKKPWTHTHTHTHIPPCSSWLKRAILSSMTLHRKANQPIKPITLNISQELWTRFFLARNPCYSFSSQIIICYTLSA